MTTNVIKKINEDKSMNSIAFYESSYSALYAMVLFICEKKRWNRYDVANQAKAKQMIEISGNCDKILLFNDSETKTNYCIEPNEIHKDVFDGTYGSKLDF